MLSAVLVCVITLVGLLLPKPEGPQQNMRDFTPRTNDTALPKASGVSAQGAIGNAVAAQTGTATYCAPTPKYCHGWGGNAHLGAVRSFHWGDKPYTVTVTYHGRHTKVRVVSFCACPNTLIDLSPAAFDDLAPLSAGRIHVTVIRSWPPIVIPPPPPTDTSP